MMVDTDLTWSVFIEQCHVDVSKPSQTVDSSILAQLLKKVNDLRMCEEQADNHFIRMLTAKKGTELWKVCCVC